MKYGLNEIRLKDALSLQHLAKERTSTDAPGSEEHLCPQPPDSSGLTQCQESYQSYPSSAFAGTSPRPISSDVRPAAMKERLFLLLIKMGKLSPRLFSFHSFLLSALIPAFNMLKSYRWDEENALTLRADTSYHKWGCWWGFAAQLLESCYSHRAEPYRKKLPAFWLLLKKHKEPNFRKSLFKQSAFLICIS